MKPLLSIIEQIDPPLSETRVTTSYGGIGLLLCRLGFHDQHYLDAEGDGRATITFVCLRCGRTLATVETEWEEDDG